MPKRWHMDRANSVSYTHLDVYKRQDQRNSGDDDGFSLTDACENRGFDDMFVQKPGAIAQFWRV